MPTAPTLISPYGSELVELRAGGEERARLVEEANRTPSIQLSDRSVHVEGQ